MALDDGALGEQPGVGLRWSPIMKASLFNRGLAGAIALALSTTVASAQPGNFGAQQQSLSGGSAVILARVGGSVHGGGMGGHGGHGFGTGHSFHVGHVRGFGVFGGPYYGDDFYDGCRWSARFNRRVCY